MSGYSHTGTWAVKSDTRLIGPFDGYSPALSFCRELRRQGFKAETMRLWSPNDVREAIKARSPEINE